MKWNTYPTSLRWNLLVVIALKILFLCAFWQLVLKFQARHADADDMAQQLLSSTTLSQER